MCLWLLFFELFEETWYKVMKHFWTELQALQSWTAIFHLCAKAMLLLNTFSHEILWKIDLKKQLTVISQKLGRIQSQNFDFLRVHLIFFRTTLFSAGSTHLGTRQGALLPKTPGVTASDSQGSKG